ncbi:MAG: GIY-YIG nuclease family protein [Bacilli bacterium]
MKIGNLEVYGVIYKIRNKINNKIYIGQTTQGFDKRYNGGIVYKTSSKHLKKSILKYGIENFEIDKIFDIAYSKKELDKLEDMYIKIYETTNNEFGYNNKFGGSYGKHIKITREKISKSLIGNQRAKGKNIGNKHAKGNKLSEETKKQMGLSRMGNTNNGSAYIKCIETGEIHRTREWILLGYRNAYQVAKGNRKHCKNLHFKYVDIS